MKRFLMCFAVIFGVTGCASVEDFRKMTPGERANKVCSSRSQYQSLDTQKQQYGASISTTQLNLSRGYMIHTQCKNVEIRGNTTTNCNANGFGNTTCTQDTPTRTQEQCTEVPVSLNYDLERDKLNLLQKRYADANTQLNNFWRSCTNYVAGLSPEDAYIAYKK